MPHEVVVGHYLLHFKIGKAPEAKESQQRDHSCLKDKGSFHMFSDDSQFYNDHQYRRENEQQENGAGNAVRRL